MSVETNITCPPSLFVGKLIKRKFNKKNKKLQEKPKKHLI